MRKRKQFMVSHSMQEGRNNTQGSNIVHAIDAVEAMSFALFELARDGNLAGRNFDKISLSVGRYQDPYLV